MRWFIAAAVAAFLALGVWQLQRRAEKLDLIAQVEQRIAAPPVAAPGPERWAMIGQEDAYTRVLATGSYRRQADTRVQAVTRYGGGHWLLTPLDTGRFTLLVNRGFVPADHPGPVPPPQGRVVVRGLLRLSEPGGGFLRGNDPAADRWSSRDVPAIAARRGLGRVVPYFVDADAGATPVPRGGLTTVRFANNHLLYALTWFACAVLLATLGWRAWRARHRGGTRTGEDRA